MIVETLEKYPTLRSTRPLEMVRQRGYTGQISLLREAVATLRPRGAKEAYLRLTTLPRAGKTPYVRFDRNDYSVPHMDARRDLLDRRPLGLYPSHGHQPPACQDRDREIQPTRRTSGSRGGSAEPSPGHSTRRARLLTSE